MTNMAFPQRTFFLYEINHRKILRNNTCQKGASFWTLIYFGMGNKRKRIGNKKMVKKYAIIVPIPATKPNTCTGITSTKYKLPKPIAVVIEVKKAENAISL